MPKIPKLFVGARIRFDGVVRIVVGFEGGCAVLRSSEDGSACRVLLVSLLQAQDFAVLDNEGRSVVESTLADPTFPDLLHDEAHEEAEENLAHLREAVTGYRSGNVATALPGEPKPEYDRHSANLSERMRAKADEQGVSVRTLWRRKADVERRGIEGLADARKIRPSNPLGELDPRVHRSILEVLDELTDKSSVTRNRMRRLVQLHLDAEYGRGVVPCPKPSRFNEIVAEIGRERRTFGSAKGRREAANTPDTPYGSFSATRPGEVVLIDSSPLDAHALDQVSYRWVSVQLTLAYDLYTRSIVGWRLTPRDAGKVDAAFILYDTITPEPMRPSWPQEASFARRYAGVPEKVVVELGDDVCDGEEVAAIPAVNPESVLVDRGRIYVSQAFQDACARLGIDVVLARPRRPSDKSPIERVFETIRESFVENLAGYKGPDLYSRGANVENEAFFFVDEIECYFAEWVATYWQQRHHMGLDLPCSPGLHLSPNDMYEEGIARAGFCYALPGQYIYYDLLPTEWRTVQDYGVEVKGLRYDGEALNTYRRRKSPYGGVHREKWPLRYDPRDRSRVFFFDPGKRQWHALLRRSVRNIHTPFNDSTLAFAKAKIVERGGNPKNHEELSAVLDSLVERIERHELHGKEERRLAARQALHDLRVRHDRRGADPLTAPTQPQRELLHAPDAPADLFNFDLDTVPVMPDADRLEDEDEEPGENLIDGVYEEENW